MKITQGDTYTTVTCKVYKNGTLCDLTNAYVKFYMRNKTSNNVYSIVCTVSNNVISFIWNHLTTVEPGVYIANYYIYFPSGDAISIPNERYIDIVIKEAITPLGASALILA